MNLQVYSYICRQKSFSFFNTAKFFIVLKLQKLPKCSQTINGQKKYGTSPRHDTILP